MGTGASGEKERVTPTPSELRKKGGARVKLTEGIFSYDYGGPRKDVKKRRPRTRKDGLGQRNPKMHKRSPKESRHARKRKNLS